MSAAIHPTAVIDADAKLDRDVIIGPHCYIGPQVVVGPRCHLRNHVTLVGPTTIGSDNIFFANTVLGEDPQDLKYQGGPTRLEIGDRNTFRESVTVHRGTETGGGVTTIGHDNHIMVGVHVGHDAWLGRHIIVANNTLIAGHVRIEDYVTIGGGSAIHHFCTIGRHAFIGGMTRITIDVPPYMIFAGYDGRVRGVNSVGLRRRGFDEATIADLKRLYRTLYGKRAGSDHATLADALHAVENNGPLDEHAAYLLEFAKRSATQAVRGRHLEAKRPGSTRRGTRRSGNAPDATATQWADSSSETT